MEKIYEEIKLREPPDFFVEMDGYTCNHISELPQLSSYVKTKAPTAKYVYIESLTPEDESPVFNLVIFDDKKTHIGGLEITESTAYWDDD